MICSEPIIGVYLGQRKDELTYGGDLFLDCYQEEIVLYLTSGFRYLLETEHFGISVEYDGVFVVSKNGVVESLEKSGEWFHSFYDEEDDPEDSPWIDHEFTFFAGERLQNVEKVEDGYVLKFDDFELKLVPCEEEQIQPKREKLWEHGDHQMYGFDRYLTKKCECGGKAVPFLDFVSDYYIECGRCGKGISNATMNLQDAIDDWDYIHA